jgi:hypothetical protein
MLYIDDIFVDTNMRCLKNTLEHKTTFTEEFQSKHLDSCKLQILNITFFNLGKSFSPINIALIRERMRDTKFYDYAHSKVVYIKY